MFCASKDFGSGPDLLFFHGLFGDGDNLYSLARRLDHYHRHLFDLPNHGKSEGLPSVSVPEMAKVILEQIRPLNSPTLIGHSLGGKVAMEMALTEPQKFPALVILDIGPLGSSPRHKNVLEGITKIDPKNYKEKKTLLKDLTLFIPEDETRAFIAKSLKEGPQGLYWAYGLEGLSKGYNRLWEDLDLHRIYEKPVLLLTGEESDYVDDKQLKGMKKVFPLLEHHSLPKAGHWLHAQAPDRVADFITSFLSNRRRSH